jgi:CRP/FNR family transcriptional regulator, cyclic AMP receptor protein
MKIHLFDNTTDFVVVPADHVVFSAGDTGDCMYAVIGGEVDILVNGKVIETVDAGGIFGEMALIEDLPRSATAVVRSEAKLVSVNRNRFLFMVQQTPFFALQLITIITGRLRRLMAEKL